MGTGGKAAQAGLRNRALVVLAGGVRSHAQVEKQTVCKLCTSRTLRAHNAPLARGRRPVASLRGALPLCASRIHPRIFLTG
jgi:hypothetical protein